MQLNGERCLDKAVGIGSNPIIAIRKGRVLRLDGRNCSPNPTAIGPLGHVPLKRI